MLPRMNRKLSDGYGKGKKVAVSHYAIRCDEYVLLQTVIQGKILGNALLEEDVI